VDQAPEKLERWKELIAQIAAECPNVCIKCGGYQMVNSNMKLEQRDTPVGSEELCAMVLPIYQHVIECFTPARCMFESNVSRTTRVSSFSPRNCSHCRAGGTGQVSCDSRALRPLYVRRTQFPPDKECVSHRVLYNTFKRIAGAIGLNEAEKLVSLVCQQANEPISP